MHRFQIVAISAMIFLTTGFWGCAGSAGIDDKMPATMATVNPATGFKKKIGVVLTHVPSSAMGQQMGDLFFNTLVQSIRAEDKRLRVITPKDGISPPVMVQMSRQPGKPIDAIELARHGREAGYNGLVSAALRGIRPYSKKTGILWFRKISYFISFDLTVDLYDTLTAAKIVGAVEEASVKVSDVEYEAFLESVTADTEELVEEIVEFGEELGELVAESLKDRSWMTSVVKVENDRIFLPAGKQAGLKPGTRLAVFEGRRMMAGLGQERFIVPGPQVGMIRISSISPDASEAVALGDQLIQAGDIAVPVK